MTRKHIFAALLAGMTLTSCSDYLKEDSGDLLIPESVSDYAALFRGEAYPDNFTAEIDFVNLMTDDVEMGPLYYGDTQKSDKKVTWQTGIDLAAGYGEAAFIWSADYSENIIDKFWSARYENILGCNAVIDALPEMTYDKDTEEGMYRALAAQAYAMRAYHYFCLINTYAKPWSEANLNEPGVVLKTSPDIELNSGGRATIGEVYAQINSDIKKAQEYIAGANFQCEKFVGQKPELTSAAIYFLAARIALFQEDWDGVIAAGEKFLAKNSAIYDLNSCDMDVIGVPLSGLGSDDDKADNVYIANDQDLDEVVFGFDRTSYLKAFNYLSGGDYLYYEYGYHTSWEGDGSLIKLYDADDLRLSAYFMRPCYKVPGKTNTGYYIAGQYKPMKYDSKRSSTNCFRQAWRTPEIYLDMAEAYARKSGGVSTQAIGYLNQLRVKKYTSGSENAEKKASDFTDSNALVKFIWEERRRELCFEELMRFWDMRREGMPAQEHHLFSSATNYTVYKLPQGSTNYVLPIPEDEASYNDNIVNNERTVIGASGTSSVE